MIYSIIKRNPAKKARQNRCFARLFAVFMGLGALLPGVPKARGRLWPVRAPILNVPAAAGSVLCPVLLLSLIHI